MGFVTTFTITVVVGFVIMLVIAWNRVEKEFDQQQKAEVAELVKKIEVHLNKVNTLKTTSSRINHCDKALALLKQAKKLPQYRSVISNYDELVEKTQCVKKVLPVSKYLVKASKHNFKGKDSSEKNSLLDALYEIEMNDITN